MRDAFYFFMCLLVVVLVGLAIVGASLVFGKWTGTVFGEEKCYSVETIKGKNYIATDLVKVRVVDCD